MKRLRPRTGTGALGGPLLHIDTVGSTNDRARELAGSGARHGTVVVAEQQTAGRGRQGRTWSAPPGQALTLSVLVRLDAAQLEALPLAAAVAVSEACEAVAGVHCTLKWPNDVWIDGRKVAGVLIEARPTESWAVIGIGLNVNTTTAELEDELRDTATSLQIATGKPQNRDVAFDALMGHLADWIPQLDRPSAVATAFRARDVLQGRRIAWSAGGKSQEGEAGGIEDDGGLIVFTDDGERLRLDAGEVHLERRPDTGARS